jgi:branched-chain amino acid transport system substrate-binding protein
MDSETMLSANGGLPGAVPAAAAAGGDGSPASVGGPTEASAAGVGQGRSGTATTAPVGTGGLSGGGDGDSGSGAASGSNDATGCATPGETGPIVVGSVGNYSGLGSSSAVQSLDAVNAWIQAVNTRGGVCGRQVQLVSVDDRADPAQTRAALQDLVENRGVVAFVNNWQPLTGATSIDYINSVRVPVIGSACSTPAEFESPYYFLACLRYEDFVFAAARTAVLYGGPSVNWGLVSCREAAACRDVQAALIGRGLAQQAGVNVVRDIQSSVLQPDFTSECRSLRDAGADKVFIVLDLASLNRFVASCDRQGYNPVYVQLSSSIEAATKDLPNMQVIAVTGGFSFADTSTAATQEFHETMAAYLGSVPGPGEGVGWLNAKLLEAAIETAARRSGSITRETLVEAMRTFNGETLDGLSTPLTFRDGPSAPAPCWWVTEGTSSGWTVLNDAQPVCR